MTKSAFEFFPNILPLRVDYIKELPLEEQHVEWYNFIQSKNNFILRQFMKFQLGRKMANFYTMKFLSKKIIGHSMIASFTKL